MKIQDLMEMPLGGVTTVGDWDRNSSIRDPKDRRLVKNKAVQHKLKQAFDHVNTTVYLYFVNSPKANKHTELGEVSLDWIKENLDEEVYNSIVKQIEENPMEDYTHIVFTNNKGAERKALTPWIIAHRIGHVFARVNGLGGKDKRMIPYQNIVDATLNLAESVLDLYGIDFDAKKFESSFWAFDDNARKATRHNQLIFKNFFTKLCTFKSARDNKVRDYFEIWNELIAQYLITGKVTFNPLPKSFKVGRNQTFTLNSSDPSDVNEANSYVQMVARDMDIHMQDLFDNAAGKFYVM